MQNVMLKGGPMDGESLAFDGGEALLVYSNGEPPSFRESADLLVCEMPLPRPHRYLRSTSDYRIFEYAGLA